ncbi:Annexin A5, partial [Galemys pyrenaicus]
MKGVGTDEESILTLLTSCSNAQDPGARVDEVQVEQDNQALFPVGEFKWGTDEDKFITILGMQFVSFENAKYFFSDMKGTGTDDHTVTRVVVSKTEVDMFNTSPYSMIKGDIFEDYKNPPPLILL